MIVNEIWININSGTQISNFGRIKRLPKLKNNGRAGLCLMKERISTGSHCNGYKVVSIIDENKKIVESVHRIVAKTFIANPENKLEVNHKDGNKYNNHVDNLEWVTRQENIKHAIENRLSVQYGENNPQSKLTEDKVKEIRNLYSKGNCTLNDIGNMYGLHGRYISLIVNRRRWKHIN